MSGEIRAFSVPHPLWFSGPVLTGYECIYTNPYTGMPAPPDAIVRSDQAVYAEVLHLIDSHATRDEMRVTLRSWWDEVRWVWRDAPVEPTAEVRA